MKKTIILGSFMALFAVIAMSVAHAEESATVKPLIREVQSNMKSFASSTRADIKEIREDMRNASGTRKIDLKTQIEVRKEDLANRRASTTASIKALREKRTDEISKNAQSHLGKEIERLNQIKLKIDGRLAKFDTQGASTTAARADLALAVTAINAAQVKVTLVSSVQVTADTKATSEAIRKAVKDAQSAINDAQKALTKVVKDMRGMEASVKANASSSAETR